MTKSNSAWLIHKQQFRAARLRHIAGSKWSTRKYMNMTPLFAGKISTSGAVA